MHSKKQGLLIAIITIVCIAVLSIISFIFILLQDDTSSTSLPSTTRIDVLKIQGEIGPTSANAFSSVTYDHAYILDTLDRLIADENSKGLILFIETPGGSIYQTDEVYLKLLDYKKTGRPIYASLGSIAASGGYYLASAADSIICNRNTLTGSIGVIMPSFLDISGFLSKNGIKVQTLTAGKNKSMGNMFEPMTDEQLKIYADVLGEAHEQFIQIVATGRKMDIKSVRAVADGRVFSAHQALKVHLVDVIGTLDDTISLMQKDYKLEDLEVNYLEVAPKYSTFDLFTKTLQGISHNELDTVLSLKEGLNRIGYYCTSPLVQ